MQGDLILKKQVELAALQSKNSKIRRLFILADGKRSVDQLFQLCGFDADQGTEIAEILLGEGALAIVDTTSSDIGQGVLLTDAIIEKVVTGMAHYVGPIATFLVQKKVCSGQIVTRKEVDIILISLAENIEESEDKQKFLESMSDVFWAESAK